LLFRRSPFNTFALHPRLIPIIQLKLNVLKREERMNAMSLTEELTQVEKKEMMGTIVICLQFTGFFHFEGMKRVKSTFLRSRNRKGPDHPGGRHP
jgi:hypothetical protein